MVLRWCPHLAAARAAGEQGEAAAEGGDEVEASLLVRVVVAGRGRKAELRLQGLGRRQAPLYIRQVRGRGGAVLDVVGQVPQDVRPRAEGGAQRLHDLPQLVIPERRQPE